MSDWERIVNTDDELLVKAWHGPNYPAYAYERTLDEFLEYNKDSGWDESDLRDYFEQDKTKDGTIWTIETSCHYESVGWGSTEEDAWFSAADSIRYGTDDEYIIKALDDYLEVQP